MSSHYVGAAGIRQAPSKPRMTTRAQFVDPPELHAFARAMGVYVAAELEDEEAARKLLFARAKTSPIYQQCTTGDFSFESLVSRLDTSYENGFSDYYAELLKSEIKKLVSAKTHRDALHIQAGRIAGNILPSARILKIVGEAVNEHVAAQRNAGARRAG